MTYHAHRRERYRAVRAALVVARDGAVFLFVLAVFVTLAWLVS